MAVTADHLVIIGRGRLLADASVDALLGAAAARRDVHERRVRVAGLPG
jgi:hypothetical protein